MNAMTLVHSHAGPSALIERDDMLAALTIVAGAAEKHSTVPILSNVLMMRSTEFENCILLTTTDLDLQMSVNVRANVSEDFATTVPVNTLRDILRKLPQTERNRLSLEMLPAEPKRVPVIDPDTDEQKMDADGNLLFEQERRNTFVSDSLLVRLGRANFELKSLPSDDFPEVAPFKSDPLEISLAGSAFWNALDSVKDGISKEETRYYLNGAYLHVVDGKMLAMTTTDGHRLFRQEIGEMPGIKDMPGIIIPAGAIHVMHTLLKGKNCPASMEIYVAADKFAATWGSVTLLSKTIDGTFPDYARVIPVNNDKIATVRAGKLIDAIGAVTAVRSTRGTVKLSFAKNIVIVSTHDAETGGGSMEVDCLYDDEPIEIGFSSAYLVDMLEKAAPDRREVRIAMYEAGSPTLFTGSITGLTGVQMPMRV